MIGPRGNTTAEARRKWPCTWDTGSVDPLLDAIRGKRAEIEAAQADLRVLIAYGREFVIPRPYTLTDLAEAAGMSFSGIRTCYSPTDVARVAQATGAQPRDWRAPAESQAVTDDQP